ncbi:MAG: ArsR/SmtB family transcription factor [Pseudolabrys sp.]
MHAAAIDASELLKALSNPQRLLIVCQLFEGERSVGQIAKALEIRDSTASQHLAVLRKDGVVSARRDGHVVWYSVTSAPGRAVIETLYDVYCSTGRSNMKTGKAKSPRRR